MGLPVFFDSSCARFSFSASRASARRLRRRERSEGSTSLHFGKAFARATAASASSPVAGSSLNHLFGGGVQDFEHLGDLRD